MQSRYLLDTNVFVYAFNKGLELPEAYYCTTEISKAEILSFPDITAEEKAYAEELFSNLKILDANETIKTNAKLIGEKYNLTISDATICATAYAYDLTLITNDPTLHQVTEIQIEHFYFS